MQRKLSLNFFFSYFNFVLILSLISNDSSSNRLAGSQFEDHNISNNFFHFGHTVVFTLWQTELKKLDEKQNRPSDNNGI